MDTLDSRLSEVETAWEQYLDVVEEELSGAQTSKTFTNSHILQVLGQKGQGELVTAHCLSVKQEVFCEQYLQQFWDRINCSLEDKEYEGRARKALEGGRCDPATVKAVESALVDGLEEVSTAVEQHEQQVREVVAGLQVPLPEGATHPAAQYRAAVSSLLVTSAPPHFGSLLQLYYQQRLAEFSKAVHRAHKGEDEMDRDDEDGDDDDDDGDDDDDMDEDSSIDDDQLIRGSDALTGEGGGGAGLLGAAWAARAASVAARLRRLGLGALSEEAYTTALAASIRRRLQTRQREFEQAVLEPSLVWLEAVPLQFVRILGVGGDLVQWRSRLQWLVYETLETLRTSMLFEIIVDYPDSVPAVQDLQQCLEHTNHHQLVVSAFRSTLQNRLLHPGAATNIILAQFVSTIRVLRELDPAGVLLASVRGPLQQYLRDRSDTIRCIVTMLTDGAGAGGGPNGESLLEELGTSTGDFESEGEDHGGPAEVTSKDTADDDEDWMPEAVDADPRRSAKRRGVTDIVSMLIAIYGSKDKLVKEYQTLLCKRLLAMDEYDTDREVRTLELLKLRFGESNMHNCEVMLKDIADSKRINANVKAPTGLGGRAPADSDLRDAAQLKPMDSTIVSKLFWPEKLDEKDEAPSELKLPAAVQGMLDTYAARYHTLKNPRKLVWEPQLGTVKLALQFEDGRTEEYSTDPLEATIIMQFQERKQWPASELAEAIGLSPSLLRQKAVFWVGNGVLQESGSALDGGTVYTSVEYADGAQDSTADELREMVALYEDKIIGSVEKFIDGRPAHRIHSNLRIFKPQYDRSLEQLVAVLDVLVAQGKLERSGPDMYRVPRRHH